MKHTARPYKVFEATHKQLLKLRPNVAVLPWAATEAHNFHLPYGTDIIEADALSDVAVSRANEKGARCVVLPCVPFGNDNTQLDQVVTITMRTATQAAVLHDVALSLVKQGIDRLVILNFHGGNEFKSMIRDVALELPIFITQVHGFRLAEYKHLLDIRNGDHADEFETSLLLHLTPELVDMPSAGDGATTPYALKSFKNPGVWAPRDWSALTKDTGTGDPRKSTAEKGRKIFEMLVDPFVALLVELSAAKNGDFPFVVRQNATASLNKNKRKSSKRKS